MIVSRPKISTLVSVSIFLVICFGLFVYGLWNLTEETDSVGWMVLTFSSGPVGMVVLIKILTGIKILKVGKSKFELKMPFRFKVSKFDAKDIEKWSHQIIKTYGGQYEEITWKLASGKEFGLSKQENTEFEKVLNYMKKKLKKFQA